jgi:hypothetical protein
MTMRLLLCAALVPFMILAEPVPVRYAQGLLHGFLFLSTTDSKRIATGDITQTVVQERVTNRLTFRFKDGSVHDETTIFTQRGNLRLLNYHLVQKGPAFPKPVDVLFDVSRGQVNIRYAGDDKKEMAISETMALPLDVANGLIPTLLVNLPVRSPRIVVSMVAVTPKPILVKLAITEGGEEPFLVGGSERRARHFVVDVEIGGIKGALASLLGKQPPPIHVWVLGGEAPVFLKMEGPLFYGGPLWRVELASPTWAQSVPQPASAPR